MFDPKTASAVEEKGGRVDVEFVRDNGGRVEEDAIEISRGGTREIDGADSLGVAG